MYTQKNTQRGITLIALVVTIIVLIILAGVSIAMLVGDNGIITQAQKVAQETEQARKDELQGLSSLETAIEEALGNVYNEEKGVNVPRMAEGMTPIKFTDPTSSEKGTVVETNSDDANWYNYEEKKWANAQTQDGSMWVWIPRFAYRVNESTKIFDVVFLIGTTDTYYDESGNIQMAKRCTSEDELVDTSADYTVHPAFTDETSINYRNGGWDREITGIWVAKFEAGYASGNNDAEVKASSVNYSKVESNIPSIEATGNSSGSTAEVLARNWLDGIYGETTTAIKYPVFQPLTYSMNYITNSDAYNIAKVLTEKGNIYGFTESTDSHLMKNSEWGAVAYLSKSKYGLNTVDLALNNISLNSGNKKRTETEGQTGVDSVYAVTGCTTGNTDGNKKNTTIENINATTGNTAVDGVYTWNQLYGTSASSTGNIYGIYDLSGGIWEKTTSYIAKENENLLLYGVAIAYSNNQLKNISTKYATVYPCNNSMGNSDEDTASINNWKENTRIYGDAVRETSEAGIGNTSWYEDQSTFFGLELVLSDRGGCYWNGKQAGLFAIGRTHGKNAWYGGFRATLIVA